MRCLASLAEWENLSNLCRTEWRKSEPHVRREMSMIAAHAAWHMGAWEEMAGYVDTVDNPEATGPQSQTATGAFLRAVLCVRNNQFASAKQHVERTRELMVTDLAALVGESYERSYTDMVRVQQLAELEEVCAYKQALERRAADPSGSDSRISFIQQLWRDRLRGVQRHVEVWQSLFSVRSLVVPMAQDVDNWLKFASLCRKNGRQRQAYRMLLQLLRYNPMAISQPGAPGYGAGSGAPHVMLAFLKHLWTQGQRGEAYNRMKDLVRELQANAVPPAAAAAAATAAAAAASAASGAGGGAGATPAAAGPTASRTPHAPGVAGSGGVSATGAAAGGAAAGAAAGGAKWLDRPQASLNGRAFLRLGIWQWAMNDKLDNPGVIAENLASFRAATEHAPNWAKAWHQWALFNVAVSAHYGTRDEMVAVAHVPPAVQGFFRSVALGQAAGDRTGNLQDILRLLTLWFNFGAYEEVRAALTEGFQLVSIDTWLLVIPQVIARIHTHNTDVRQLIHHLLVKIGRHHPQALMYPLLVATKSQSPARRSAAYSVLECIRQHSAALVEQAQLVSGELIRMAILWHEMWHEGLEEASRLYFGESNVEGMLNTLLPLHEMLEKTGPTTLKEIAFVQAYGREAAVVRGVRVVDEVQGLAQGGGAAPGLGPLLPRLQAHQQAAALPHHPRTAVRLPRTRTRPGPGTGGAGDLHRGRAAGHNRRLCAAAACDQLQAAAEEVDDPRGGWCGVHVPAEGSRGPASGRARHAALRACEHHAGSRPHHRGAGPVHCALRGHPAVAEQRADRLGAQLRHAACADPGVQGGPQDPTQLGAPTDAGHGARLRPPHRHPEGGGVRVCAGLHQRGGPAQGSVAQVAQQRGLAGPAHQLHALRRRDEHGGLHPGAGRPAPLQPHAGSVQRQAAAHRLWGLLRGVHEPREVPGEGSLPPDPHDDQGHGGQRHRGQLQNHVRECDARAALQQGERHRHAGGIRARPAHQLAPAQHHGGGNGGGTGADGRGGGG
ncbi:hypothetical protein Agub_g6841, partial [Astrephomene gubernaculifera]